MAPENTIDKHHGRATTAFTEDLRKQIAGGKYQRNQFLPSVRKFSRDYSLAPKTVLRGLKQLEADGLLTAQPRKGFRIKPQADVNESDRPLAYLLKGDANAWSSSQRAILEALQTDAASRGWSVLGVSANHRSPAAVMEQLRAAKACGAIFDDLDAPYLEHARRIGLPVIMFDVWTAYFDFDAVTRDEFNGGYLAGEYLAGRGHRDIAWFGPLQGSPNAVTRFAGAIAALLMAGLDIPTQRRFIATVETAEKIAEDFLDQPKRPTAVLALWRELALAMARAARRRGLELGRDLDLVGWSMEEEIAHERDPQSRAVLEGAAMVSWSIRPVIAAALDRIAQRRLHPNLKPVRIQLPMRLLPPQSKPSSS